MVTKAFSIFDVKADVYHPPFFMSTKGQALRAFEDLVRDHNTMPGRHPADFKLVEIGVFDDETGVLSSISPVVSLGFGSEFVLDSGMAVMDSPPVRKVS